MVKNALAGAGGFLVNILSIFLNLSLGKKIFIVYLVCHSGIIHHS